MDYRSLRYSDIDGLSDWLDVRPKLKIESKDLFESESGFKEALAGVYSNMTSQQLYGRDLTFGIIDAFRPILGYQVYCK